MIDLIKIYNHQFEAYRLNKSLNYTLYRAKFNFCIVYLKFSIRKNFPEKKSKDKIIRFEKSITKDSLFLSVQINPRSWKRKFLATKHRQPDGMVQLSPTSPGIIHERALHQPWARLLPKVVRIVCHSQQFRNRVQMKTLATDLVYFAFRNRI